ncbi:flavodoxin [Brachyspira hyodysenteriae]|uniref:flavodoxin n=1 Tax=Brachyspira hyodysenteriae TaxID=159 RepID=UPI002B257447|nr:flavodoxin [Brachyspira hyodysenteriae]WPC25095.1 flavodoxin [Brachyspira hyodysenteriae]
MNDKIAIIYWSGTGNTEIMAQNVQKGIENAGGEADIFSVSSFDAANINNYSKLALGCPAMGAEVLEESEFQPFYDSVRGSLSGKKIALFGSYDWGDGEWMRIWQDDISSSGASLVKDGLIANLAPDDEAINECKSLGEALLKA